MISCLALTEGATVLSLSMAASSDLCSECVRGTDGERAQEGRTMAKHEYAAVPLG